MRTRAAAAVVTVVVAAASLVGSADAAQAAAYRYWTYWQGGTGSWAFAAAGPASTIPADGSVEGWRFAVTAEAGSTVDAPTPAPSFDTICGTTPAQADRKRVALVIDPGPAAIAPTGQVPPPIEVVCVVAPPDATGYQVLRSVASVRTDGGLVCGISGYPTGECAPIVDGSSITASDPVASAAATTAPAATDAASGTPWITAAVLAVVAIVGLVLWRRRA